MRVRPGVLLLLASPLLIAVAGAYIQWGVAGLPAVVPPGEAMGPAGFAGWVRMAHFINFLLLTLLVRSGLQILMDHPRLYGNVHCTPGTEWLRLTPVVVPSDRVWTAKQDSRHLSPWIGLPGYRHTVGMARHWHFLSVLFWMLTGAVFIVLLFTSGHWQRLVPTSWRILPEAWSVFVHYATFHLPPEPNGFYAYNALQQLGYFGVVFILAPLAILTGPSMSPALTARFRWYPRLPGNRQIGRSLHFLVMCGFVLFLVIHVAMVAITGLARNMNHIVLGTDDARTLGLILGLGGIALVVLVNVWANRAAWRQPRRVQHASKAVVSPVMHLLLNNTAPVAQFDRKDISPFFWVNGEMPTSDEWLALAADGFKDYRLRVHGLVENPVELSLEELRALTDRSQITLHHCIQGWSGIAEWTGVPVAALLQLVRPRAGAGAVVFYSFADGQVLMEPEKRGQYYDSLSMENAQHSQTLLAWAMNGQPLTALHGAPLRLRVENQLGFKMVKWINAIEVVADVRTVYQGEGGFAQDNEYFGGLANI